MKTFDANEFLAQCETLSSEAYAGCGLIYELAQRRLSAAIDGYVATLPPEFRGTAIELARREYGYISAQEIEDEIERDRKYGMCSHGIDRDCCPLGCGDIDPNEF
ncbi:CcgAII protein (plasmid) [Escherichia coli]